MRTFIRAAVVFTLGSTLALAASAQGRGQSHDRGRHVGWAKHHDQDLQGHRDWNFEHERIVVGRPFPYGRFPGVGGSFAFRTIDLPARRVVLADQSTWIVAPYDLERCRDWRWDRDTVVVYDDDVHSGWYVLFNARTGNYAHVEFLGVG